MSQKNGRDTKQERKPERAARGPEPKQEPSEDVLKGPIKAGEFDAGFRKELAASPGGEKLRHCFQCGTCTSDCPIARFSDSYRPREIIRMAQLGLKKRVLSSKTLWLCAACYTCTDRCPQDVEVASVIRVLRNFAVKGKRIPSPFKELGKNIVATGIAYRIPELRLAKRAKTGLPPLSKSNRKAIEKLAEATGFDQMIQQSD
jgi:heterodisulfide reductase subunit C